MGRLLELLAVPVAFILLIGLAWLVALRLGLLKPVVKKGAVAEGDARFLAYRVRDGVLTPGERAFLPVLRDAVRIAWAARSAPASASPAVLPCVRLAEVLKVDAARADNPSAWQSALNRISAKQVDFVVCDAATTRPLLVVELDDQSHDRADRKDRDAVVDRACASAGLPILHVRAAAAYRSQDLAKRIAETLPSRDAVPG